MLTKLIIAHLNTKQNMMKETKIDESFPTNQFMINVFSAALRLDKNDRGGGFILYIIEDISSRLVSTDSSPSQGFLIEIKLKKKKK